MSNGKILSCPDTKWVDHVLWRSEFQGRVWVSEDTCSDIITAICTIIPALNMQEKLLHFLDFKWAQCPIVLYYTEKNFVNLFSWDSKKPTFYLLGPEEEHFIAQVSSYKFLLERIEKVNWRWGKYSLFSCSEVIWAQAQMNLIHLTIKEYRDGNETWWEMGQPTSSKSDDQRIRAKKCPGYNIIVVFLKHLNACDYDNIKSDCIFKDNIKI